jgi:hypothetical protein
MSSVDIAYTTLEKGWRDCARKRDLASLGFLFLTILWKNASSTLVPKIPFPQKAPQGRRLNT